MLCGAGDRFEHYRALAAGLPNVLLPGWVDAAAIHVLMRRSACGLDPLSDRYDFLATINNKAIEYFSAGLPVISSPRRGTLAELLAAEECGLSYDLGDAAGLARAWPAWQMSRVCGSGWRKAPGGCSSGALPPKKSMVA